MPESLARFAELDARLVDAARDIKILSNLEWPRRVGAEFLARWHAGDPQLPKVEVPRVKYAAQRKALAAIMRQCDRDHPVGRFLLRTAQSYALAAAMMEAAGTPAFTTRSLEIYGGPRDPVGPGQVSNLSAAERFLALTEDFRAEGYIPEQDFCVTPEAAAAALRARIDPVFKEHPIAVVIDPDMAAKAAAGSTRVRLRGGTCFTEYDVAQLVEHEVFVHSLTALNGREQTNLRALSLGAPRTTATQEGLATFAEMITNAIDLSRLRRLALRTKAVDLALSGADFIDVFRFFHDAGQDPGESFHSAARVFRGGDVAGKVVFTKDVVYLRGLLGVHTFFLKAIERGRPELIHHLFAGRMALGDALELDPFFRSGALAPPRFEPTWVKNRATLAAFLVYSVLSTSLRLAGVELDHFGTDDLDRRLPEREVPDIA
ncbi:MAG TPA: tyrosine/phenylalanine carboxypeptidase domain-containing protein [Nannocystis sp.]